MKDDLPMPPPIDRGKCSCGAPFEFSRYCGADTCERCGNHKGLSNCYCGWSAGGGDGYRNLIEDGETIEEEE